MFSSPFSSLFRLSAQPVTAEMARNYAMAAAAQAAAQAIADGLWSLFVCLFRGDV